MGVEPKIGGGKTPKMDGENNGSKPYEQMDDLGGGFTPPIFRNIQIVEMTSVTKQLTIREVLIIHPSPAIAAPFRTITSG